MSLPGHRERKLPSEQSCGDSVLRPGFLQGTLGSQTAQEPGSGSGFRHKASLSCKLSCAGGLDRAGFECSQNARNFRVFAGLGPSRLVLDLCPQSQQSLCRA